MGSGLSMVHEEFSPVFSPRSHRMSFVHGLKGSERSFSRSPCGGLATTLIVILLGSGAPAYAGLVINPVFDSSITSDPNAAAIEGTINSAIQEYETRFTDPITVSINFREGTGLGS